MTPQHATQLLGLSGENPTAAQIRAAFADAVRANHPDSTQWHVRKPVNAVSIRDLQMARDVLLECVATQNSTCQMCRGVGKVRGKVGWRRCDACGGKGDTR